MPIVESFQQCADSDPIFSCPAKQEKSSAELGKKSLGKNCSTNVQRATAQENMKWMRNQQEVKESRPLTTNFLSPLMCVKSDAGEFREHAPRPPG